MKHVCSIERLLKNDNVTKSQTSKNPTTALYSETTKQKKTF